MAPCGTCAMGSAGGKCAALVLLVCDVVQGRGGLVRA